jgi:hypothetical protein
MPRPSEERAAAVAAVATMMKRERRSAALLIKAEGRMLARLRAAARPVIARATTSLADDRRHAMATVRRTAPLLQRSVERAIATGRAETRTTARRDLATELPAADPSGLSGREEDDAAAEHTAAASYASAWGAAAMAAVLAWSEEPERSLAAHVAEAEQDHRLRRIASTESASAFNDERRRHYEALEDSPLAPGMFKVWSAVLDRKTCPFCFGKDGQTVRLHESFGETPPVHPHCRCLLEYVRVPHPERLIDIEFDYSAFKDEAADLIREHRAVSDRHAAGFLRDSMGARRSPEVLTEKFRRGAYRRNTEPTTLRTRAARSPA